MVRDGLKFQQICDGVWSPDLLLLSHRQLSKDYLPYLGWLHLIDKDLRSLTYFNERRRYQPVDQEGGRDYDEKEQKLDFYLAEK